MLNVAGLMRSANHAVVAGSSRTIDRPPRRKLSTAVSLPGLASSRTSTATGTVSYLLWIRAIRIGRQRHRPVPKHHRKLDRLLDRWPSRISRSALRANPAR